MKRTSVLSTLLIGFLATDALAVSAGNCKRYNNEKAKIRISECRIIPQSSSHDDHMTCALELIRAPGKGPVKKLSRRLMVFDREVAANVLSTCAPAKERENFDEYMKGSGVINFLGNTTKDALSYVPLIGVDEANPAFMTENPIVFPADGKICLSPTYPSSQEGEIAKAALIELQALSEKVKAKQSIDRSICDPRSKNRPDEARRGEKPRKSAPVEQPIDEPNHVRPTKDHYEPLFEMVPAEEASRPSGRS